MTSRPDRRTRKWPIISLALRHEADVVLVRQRARLIAERLGFGRVDQTRIATATSEVARNALQHGGGGRAEYAVEGSRPAALVIRLSDVGPGLEPPAASDPGDALPLGAGTGLVLSRRLMDGLTIDSPPAGGTRVTLRKHLPAEAEGFGAQELQVLVDELARRPPETLLEELQQQQQELTAVLDDLVSRQEALTAANLELEETNRGVMALYGEVAQELEDTNRGVLALYAQLDDQTQRLREVDALKDRFISHLSHEFRTPLHSVVSLTRLLLDRLDGPLGDEQERQVALIRNAAVDLLGMVDDLLDVAKIQAGKLRIEREAIDVGELFRDLRGMFRPMASEAGLGLHVEEPEALPPLVSDRQKVSQVLRNLIGNALKFTEEGEVRLTAAAETSETLRIEVRDTGVGIPLEAQQRVFEEYEQVDASPGQRTRGTGLGLPLSRRLAALLGGSLELESQPGAGSTFTLRLPFEAELPEEPEATPRAEPPFASPAVALPADTGGTTPLALVVDDDPAARYLVERLLSSAGWRVLEAGTGEEGLSLARREPPALVVLDLALPGISGYDVLDALRESPESRDLPVLIVTSASVSPAQVRTLGTRTAGLVLKSDPRFDELIRSAASRIIAEGPTAGAP